MFFFLDLCTCARKSDVNNEGGECNAWKGSGGVWCYAETETCTEARANPDKGAWINDNFGGHKSSPLPGLGESRLACQPGKILIMSTNGNGCNDKFL